MDYRQAHDALSARVPTRIEPGLERMRMVVDLLDHPERTAPAVHVTGTNGKTTTARIIATLLTAFDVGTGLYTSPHLQDVRERLRVGPRVISEMEFAETWSYLEPFFSEVDQRSAAGSGPQAGVPVTFFEALTTMAFAWFADLPVDAAVYEVGMGGLWDATNVVDAGVAVLGPIDVDHPELGDTPGRVAVEKAGIVKDGATVVSAMQPRDAAQVVDARVAETGARLLVAERDFGVGSRRLAYGGQVLELWTPAGRIPDVLLPLHGRHQAANAALALTAVEAFLGDRALDADVVRAGFAEVTSPGRLEVVGRKPLVILDGAHNPAGARALAAALLEEFVVDRRTMVVACLADKDIAGILGGLAPAIGRLILTETSSPRTASANALGKEAEALGLVAEVIPVLADALRAAAETADERDAIVVTGSLYTVGEARTALLGAGPA